MDFEDIHVARRDYQLVTAMAGLSAVAPVVLDVPASGQDQMLDLRASKLILTFQTSVPLAQSTVGWCAGLLFANSVRVYLNGKEVGLDGNLAPFAAFHRALFQRPGDQAGLVTGQGFNYSGYMAPDQLTTYVTSPWILPLYDSSNSTVLAEYGFNDLPWSGQMAERLLAANGGAGQILQVQLPLDLLIPFIDSGRLLDNSTTHLRIEAFPANPTFAPMKTLDSYSMTPTSAVLYLNRVTLNRAGVSALQTHWAQTKLLTYDIHMFPTSTTFLLPGGTTSFNQPILLSGSKPQMLVVHFVQTSSLTLSNWTATDKNQERNHVFQSEPGAYAPAVTSMNARIQSQKYPRLWDVSRVANAAGGTALLDYEQYRQSCKDPKNPYLGYRQYTDSFGVNVYTINLNDGLAAWDAPRNGDRVSLDLQIQFAGPVGQAGNGMVVTVLSREQVVISQSGNVAKTW